MSKRPQCSQIFLNFQTPSAAVRWNHIQVIRFQASERQHLFCDTQRLSFLALTELTDKKNVAFLSIAVTTKVGYTLVYMMTLIAKCMGPTWGPSGADRTQMGPILAPRTLLSGDINKWKHYWLFAWGIQRHRWIPLIKASYVELWCFLWSAPWINGWVNNREAGDLRRHRAHYNVMVMNRKCNASITK